MSVLNAHHYTFECGFREERAVREEEEGRKDRGEKTKGGGTNWWEEKESG